LLNASIMLFCLAHVAARIVRSPSSGHPSGQTTARAASERSAPDLRYLFGSLGVLRRRRRHTGGNTGAGER
jgi:hypothetical protein